VLGSPPLGVAHEPFKRATKDNDSPVRCSRANALAKLAPELDADLIFQILSTDLRALERRLTLVWRAVKLNYRPPSKLDLLQSGKHCGEVHSPLTQFDEFEGVLKPFEIWRTLITSFR
jgi:hypothetical protein